MFWRLTALALGLNLKRLWYFRASVLLEALSSLVYSVITIVFWNIIYDRVHPLPGWTLGQTFAFVALLEFFYALTMSIFIGSGKLWTAIIAGRIDIYLVRPVDARLLMSLLVIRIENLIRALPGIGLLLFLAITNGARFSTAAMFTALVTAVLGAVCYACLQMAGSFASFWLGRAEVLDELTDSLKEVVQYPHTIFPEWVQWVLMTVLPMAFAASEPARALMVAPQGSLGIVGAAILVTSGWWLVQELTWRRGLRHYDSFSG